MTTPTAEELGLDNAKPPAGAEALTDIDVVKKGEFFVKFNEGANAWHVQRVMRAGRPERRSYGVSQSNIIMVNHDAVPDEGKSGTAYSHYSGHCGWFETSLTSLVNPNYDENRWFRINPAAPGMADWIAAQDQAWVDYSVAKQEQADRAANTPKSFNWRMNQLAHELEIRAERLEAEVSALRKAAAAVRAEKSPEWTK